MPVEGRGWQECDALTGTHPQHSEVDEGVNKTVYHNSSCQTHVEDAKLKSRMRENLTFGSVRGLIVASGQITQKGGGYGLYSRRNGERVLEKVFT